MRGSFSIDCPKCNGMGCYYKQIIGTGSIELELEPVCERCNGRGRIKVKEVKDQ